MATVCLRVLIVVQLFFLLSLQLTLWEPAGVNASVQKITAEIAQINAELDGFRAENLVLAEDIVDLKSKTSAIEELARSNLGMIKPGELFVLLVD